MKKRFYCVLQLFALFIFTALTCNPPTRSGKPSDLVAAGLGVQNATLIDLLPGANLGKDVVAGGVQVRVLSTVSLNILEIEFVCIH